MDGGVHVRLVAGIRAPLLQKQPSLRTASAREVLVHSQRRVPLASGILGGRRRGRHGRLARLRSPLAWLSLRVGHVPNRRFTPAFRHLDGRLWRVAGIWRQRVPSRHLLTPQRSARWTLVVAQQRSSPHAALLGGRRVVLVHF